MVKARPADRPIPARFRPLLLFLAAMSVGAAALSGATSLLDAQILRALAGPTHDHRWLALAMEAFTTAGDRDVRIALTLIALVLLAWVRQWKRAVLLLGMTASGAALVSSLKVLTGRARPDLLPPLDWETSASLPSGHAANGMILYLGLVLLFRGRLGQGPLMAALLLVLLIGMSRVALAVHWPSDVLAGWCLGAGWAWLWTLPLQQNTGPEAERG